MTPRRGFEGAPQLDSEMDKESGKSNCQIGNEGKHIVFSFLTLFEGHSWLN